MSCPNCHQDAPTIVRGMRAYCTACGAPRPLVASVVSEAGAVNIAGQPARVGGSIAGGLGVAALIAGAVLALIFGGLAGLIFTVSTAIWVGGTITALTLLAALPLILGGRRLRQAGEGRVREAQEHAVFSLAAQRRGLLTVRDVARALSVREAEADALLTDLAKRPDGRVTLDVDDEGGLTYTFHDLRPAAAGRVRVAEQPWQTPTRVAQPGAAPRIIDAELIDEEGAPPAAARRAVR
jgi:hypothetical protein